MRTSLRRWRRPIVATAFGICAAATMLLAAEWKFYEDTLAAFDRVQIGMNFQEVHGILQGPAWNSPKHPERSLAYDRTERVGEYWLHVHRVGNYRLEIVFKYWEYPVWEKRRNPETWTSLAMASVRHLFRLPIEQDSVIPSP